VKSSDDYRAKVRLWASRPTVVPLPAGPALPMFKAWRFSTHQEMNAWKRALLREVARQAARHE
jgi:hypothetical protein